MIKRIGVFFVLLNLCALGTIYAEEVVPGKNGGYINRDGSSIARAIIMDDISNYKECTSYDCVKEEYRKSLDREYTLYIPQMFGQERTAWKPKSNNLSKYHDRYYDKVTIKLVPSGEGKVIYFDVTEPFIELTNQLASEKYTEDKDSDTSEF